MHTTLLHIKKLNETESPIFVLLCVLCFQKGNPLDFLLCSPKNFGGAYSRRFVRASVRPCVRASVRPYVRASVRPCVRPALVHANSRKLLVGFQ